MVPGLAANAHPTNFVLPNQSGMENNSRFLNEMQVYGEIWVKDNTTETTLNSAAKAQILVFTDDGDAEGSKPEFEEGHIEIKKAGKYMVNVAMSMSNTAGQGHVVSVGLFVNNGEDPFNNVHAGRGLTTASTVGNAHMSGICNFDVGDTVELWAITDSGQDRNVLFEDVTLSITRVGKL